MKKSILAAAAALLLATVASPVKADPLGDVINWCSSNTGSPRVEHMGIIMPDGKPRGTRNPATLTAEARAAKARGDCGAAVQWLIHCQEHDEGGKNVLRANPGATCSRL